MSDMRTRKAFTLIELLLTIGVIAIIGGTVIALSLVSGSYQSQLSGVTQEIISEARNAQLQSAYQSNGAQWGIHFENSTGTAPFYAVFTGNSYASGTVQTYNRLPSAIGFATSTLPTGTWIDITFAPISGASNASLTLGLYALPQPSISSTVVISRIGLVNSGSPQPNPLHLWASVYKGPKVLEFDLSGRRIFSFGSYGSTDGHFENLTGIGSDPKGNLYITDITDRLQVFTSNGGFVRTVAPQTTSFGAIPVGADKKGNIYPVESPDWIDQYANGGSNFVTHFEIGGGVKATDVCSTALDGSGNVYVRVSPANESNSFIYEFGQDGSLKNSFSWNTADGPTQYCGQIAVNSHGMIYATDPAGLVDEFDPHGHPVGTLTGNGLEWGSGYLPWGIAIDANDNVYVANGNCGVIVKFDSAGNFISRFGSKDATCVDDQGFAARGMSLTIN